MIIQKYFFLFVATYNMTMRLGEVNGPGTDGNVYIQLLGEKGNTAKIQLRQSGDVKNKFETDELYKFTVGTVDIGKVKSILICSLGGFYDTIT